ncbi:MAG: carboxypeptidase-like regulatory domain-containing protein [Chloroflexota bacterium]
MLHRNNRASNSQFGPAFIQIMCVGLIIVIAFTFHSFVQANPLAMQSENGGTIAGTVTNAQGTPLPNIKVIASPRRVENRRDGARTTVTDSDGNYAIDRLLTGIYRVEFQDPSGAFVHQFYGNMLTAYEATDVFIDGDTASDIDAQLQPSSHLLGTVTTSGEYDVRGIQVSLYKRDLFDQDATPPFYERQEISGGEGTYDFGGLPAGTYAICAKAKRILAKGDGCFDALGGDVETATEISLAAGEIKTGIDISFEVASTVRISGTVRSEQGEPLDDVNVEIYQRRGDSGDLAYERNELTDQDGHFTFKYLPDGQYTLYFSRSSDPIVEEYWEDAQTVEGATFLTINETTPYTELAVRLSRGAVITGHVIPDSSVLLTSNAQVRLYAQEDSEWILYRNGPVDTQTGHYRIQGLKIGEYKVSVRTHLRDQQYESFLGGTTLSDAEVISVSQNSVIQNEVLTDLDIEFDPSPKRASISGMVTSNTGALLAGIKVSRLYEVPIQQEKHWFTDEVVFTDSDGQFRFDYVPNGEYTLLFEDSAGAFTAGYFGNSQTIEQAQLFRVTDTENFHGAEMVMSPTGAVAGTVRIDDAEIPEDGKVTLYQQKNTFLYSKGHSTLSESGEFLIDGLAPGAYILKATVRNHPSFAIEGNYSVSNDGSATEIQVESGQTTPINMSLPSDSFDHSISGTITENGQPLSNIRVEVYGGYPAPAQFHGPNGAAFFYTYTDEFGQFVIESFLSGLYWLGFIDEDGRYASKFYGNQDRLSKNDPIELTGSTKRVDIEVTLEEAGAIEGYVWQNTEDVAPDVRIILYWLDDELSRYVDSTRPDEMGHFQFDILPPGHYQLDITQPSPYLPDIRYRPELDVVGGKTSLINVILEPEPTASVELTARSLGVLPNQLYFPVTRH